MMIDETLTAGPISELSQVRTQPAKPRTESQPKFMGDTFKLMNDMIKDPLGTMEKGLVQLTDPVGVDRHFLMPTLISGKVAEQVAANGYTGKVIYSQVKSVPGGFKAYWQANGIKGIAKDAAPLAGKSWLLGKAAFAGVLVAGIGAGAIAHRLHESQKKTKAGN